MDAVVDLGQSALEIPAEFEPVVFFVFEALELLDEIKLEFRAEPGSEFEGDVLVGVGSSTVTPGARLKSNSSRGFDPLPGSQRKAVESGLLSKGLEFETFKIRIMDLLPNTNEFEGVAIAHPVVDKRIITKFFRHVGQGYEIVIAARNDGDGGSLNLNGAFLGFAHRVGLLGGMTPNPSNSTGLNRANSPQLKQCLNAFMIQGAN